MTKEQKRAPIDYTTAVISVTDLCAMKVTGWKKLEGLGVIYGQQSSGKSFAALDLAHAVAKGNPWGGLKTVPGCVLYILAEGVQGFRKRLRAYHLHNNITEVSVSILAADAADTPCIDNAVDVNDLIYLVNKKGDVSLIIFDSLYFSTKSEVYDMGLIITNCKKIQEQTGASVLLISERQLFGSWDFEIEVKAKGHARSMTVRQPNLGSEPQEFGFKLVKVVIGTDDDDEPVDSCIVEFTDDLPDQDED